MSASVKAVLDDPSINWQGVVLAITVTVASLESYINGRQKEYYSPRFHPHIPATLQSYLPASTRQETYTKSQQYNLDKHNFGVATGIIDVVESYVLLSRIALPLWQKVFGHVDTTRWTLLRGLWDLSKRVPGATSEIRTSMAFSVLLVIIETVISIPKSYYKNFVLEETHGFNKMTRSTFVKDQFLGIFVSLLIQTPLIAGIIKIIQRVGTDRVATLVSYILVLIAAMQIAMVIVYPYVIAPLFNKFTPLAKDSPVFPRVEALAKRLDFPLGRVWVMDGSKRSAHSNAFFFGLPFLTKHIVIFDTLIEKATPEEIEAILAHELGHWKGMHVLVLLGVGLANIAFSFSTFTLFLSHAPLLASFGFTNSRDQPIIVSLLLAGLLFQPLNAITHFMTNTITRKLEYDADAFACKLGKETAVNLKGALVTIHEKNLALCGTDWLYSAYNNSHPTLIERLDALDRGVDSKSVVGGGDSDAK